MHRRQSDRRLRLPPVFCAILTLTAAGCTASSAPLPPRSAPEPESGLQPFAYETVWTRTPDVGLVTDSGTLALIHPFTRLDVLGRDSIGLVVACQVCDPPTVGRVREEDVIMARLAPEVAAWGELVEFVFSIRDAARRHDIDALLPIMAPDFSYDFVGVQTRKAAVEVWRAEEYRSLDELVEILDQGLATHGDGIWSAPPDFVSDRTYQRLRTGVRRRPDGRWEWLYLIRGIGAR